MVEDLTSSGRLFQSRGSAISISITTSVWVWGITSSPAFDDLKLLGGTHLTNISLMSSGTSPLRDLKTNSLQERAEIKVVNIYESI